jgi:hypothetical protein
VNAALRSYWTAHIEEIIAPKTRSDVDRAIAEGEGVLFTIDSLISNDDIFKGASDEEAEHLEDALQKACDALVPALNGLNGVKSRLMPNYGRKSFGPLSDLIRDLDRILQINAGAALSRSKNRIKPGAATSLGTALVSQVVIPAREQVHDHLSRGAGVPFRVDHVWHPANPIARRPPPGREGFSQLGVQRDDASA